MQINPGGSLDTKDVIGRDDEIARYWRVLERQGLVISAERRIGKTHIVWKMRDECRPSYLPFYQDLEHVHTTARAHSIDLRDRPPVLEGVARAQGAIRQMDCPAPRQDRRRRAPHGRQRSAGTARWRIRGSARNRRREPSAGGARGTSRANRIILMLWDEFPLMLHNIQRREGPDSAMQLLDRLRALRLLHADRLRFLFTGSIGLHLVLRSLRKAGNVNDPVNDMLSLTVPPMADEGHVGPCSGAAAGNPCRAGGDPRLGLSNSPRGRRLPVLRPPCRRPA